MVSKRTAERLKAVEWFAIEQFEELVSGHGYKGPKVSCVSRAVTIVYLKGALGVEVVFDWSWPCVEVRIVRLEKGKLPDGYRVSNGRECRKYLDDVVREQKWTDKPLVPHRWSREGPTEDEIKKYLLDQKRLLLDCLPLIEEAGEGVFGVLESGGGMG
jgi:hypothetical protein